MEPSRVLRSDLHRHSSRAFAVQPPSDLMRLSIVYVRSRAAIVQQKEIERPSIVEPSRVLPSDLHCLPRQLTKIPMAAAWAAYLVFTILVASISPSSPSRASAAASYAYRHSSPPLPPLHRQIILFSHDGSPPPWPPSNKSPLKPFRRLNAQRKYKCPKESEKRDKHPERSQEPWPECPIPASPPPPF
ncbi:unnamed protein product [Citrullus colocynthis]|uniref:Uncharacterized protein n=1 Tax=Citrullus colocynthis TaxID=252529 RepID=A0ABP0XZA5_9ROSI